MNPLNANDRDNVMGRNWFDREIKILLLLFIGITLDSQRAKVCWLGMTSVVGLVPF